MGVANSKDIFQHNMNDSFHGLEITSAYIYDLFILTQGYWTDHVQKPESTLNKLKEKGIKYNIEKSFFGKREMEYSVLWVTHDVDKPMNRKI